MKLFKSITLLICVLPLALNAQIPRGQGLQGGDINSMIITPDGAHLEYLGDDGYNGTPFLNEDYQFGGVDFGNKKLSRVKIRYNVLLERMELNIGEGETMRITDPEAVAYIDGKQFEPYKYMRDGNNTWGYFEVIYEDPKSPKKAKVLLKHVKTLEDGAQMKLGDSRPPKDKLEDNSWYYVLIEKMPVKVGRKKASEFVLLFDKQFQNKLVEYIEENRLNPRREKDLVKIIKYYNQLKK